MPARGSKYSSDVASSGGSGEQFMKSGARVLDLERSIGCESLLTPHGSCVTDISVFGPPAKTGVNGGCRSTNSVCT